MMALNILEQREKQLHIDATRLKALTDTKGVSKHSEAELKRLQAEKELLAFHRKAYESGNDQLDLLAGDYVKQANYGFSEADLKGLHYAVTHKGTYLIPGEEAPQYQTKAAFSESAVTGVTGGFNPPVLLPQNTLGLLIDPSDIFASFIQQAAPVAESVQYQQHTSNANPAAYTPELGTLPDLGMVWTPKQVTFETYGATADFSIQSLQDFPTFTKLVPAEMHVALRDTVNNAILNSSTGLTGLLHETGTLTRTQATSEYPVQTLRLAIADIRSGSAYGTANTVIMNPLDVADIQNTLANTSGLFMLDPIQANGPDGQVRFNGLDVIQTTKIAAGTAVVYDRNRAALSWTRTAPSLEINNYGGSAATSNLWSSYAVSFRIVTRIGFSLQYPTAVNVVTLTNASGAGAS